MKLDFFKYTLFLKFIFILFFILISQAINAQEISIENVDEIIFDQEKILNKDIKVQITEIFPFTLDGKKEWFEFSVSGEEIIDMSEWIISNGKTEKKFKDIIHALLWNQNIEKIENNEDKILFKIKEKGFFSWEVSPISLPDSGGEIKITNSNNAILSQVQYPKLKKGSKDKKSFSEVWTFDVERLKFFPLLYFPEIISKQHSKLKENKKSPTFPQDVEILISEFSPSRKDNFDFIEIFIKKGNGKINLKYAELKVNGTPLWRFEDDFFVESGDFLVFNVGADENKFLSQKKSPFIFETSKISGLSSGSTSVEFNLFAETSLEKNEDFVCFKKENLSQSEKIRVDKNIEEKNWSGDCVELKNIIKNQSFARVLQSIDNHNLNDFLPHFNGSPGEFNKTQNNSPKAIINIQGSGKTVGDPPFSLNLTGEFSSDPDGKQDIKSFIWKINEKIFSEKENPSNYKIEDVGNYEIKLTIEDYSGSQNIASLNIFVQKKLNQGSSSGSQTTKVIEALLQDSLNFKKLSTKSLNKKDESLFAEILQNKSFINSIIQDSQKIRTPNYGLKKKQLPFPKRVLRKKYSEQRQISDKNFKNRKIILPIQVRHRLKKNIGLIYSWREQSWQALKEELIFYEEARQNFEYFEAMYF